MCAGELESRLGVIKDGAWPPGGGMALGAVLAELASVFVIPAMAGHAVLRCAGIDASGMALHARGIGMGAGELKGGLGMVKDGAGPARGSVALGAVLAELAPVLVVRRVASHTILGRAGVDVTCVALHARGPVMRAGEREGGQAVVNGRT